MGQASIILKTAIEVGGFLGAMVLMIPLYATWTYHKRKMEEIRAKSNARLDDGTRTAIEAIRAEVAALRETTTQYDMSFDSALHRLESRVAHVEQRVNLTEPAGRSQVTRA